MARKLQDRLALASYKAQHGLDNLSFNLIEAHLDKTIKQKRPGSSLESSSDTSSLHHLFSSTFGSSPHTAPFFSDGIHGSGRSEGYRKRRFDQSAFSQPSFNPSPRKRTRAHSKALPEFESSRKSSHNLPESSPVYRNQHGNYQSSHQASLSFVSEISTVPDSPSFGRVSDGDSPSLPQHSFNLHSTFKSSPPRTPPPTRARTLRHRKANVSGEEGAADLLMYLATSPSPANPSAKSRNPHPSTPPSNINNNNALPSSMMLTPGGGGGYLAGFSTPGQQFNFADFVNITPSPAQGAFGNRTPGPAKTPLAARDARRKLNFDSLAAPKEAGLGMELGGELVAPGGGSGYLSSFNTPGQGFNFADFVNITPGPAQGAFGNRTPGPPKTPNAAKEAKRKSNDSMAPPGSPNISGRKEMGLGMELGGELVSS